MPRTPTRSTIRISSIGPGRTWRSPTAPAERLEAALREYLRLVVINIHDRPELEIEENGRILKVRANWTFDPERKVEQYRALFSGLTA